MGSIDFEEKKKKKGKMFFFFSQADMSFFNVNFNFFFNILLATALTSISPHQHSVNEMMAETTNETS